MFGFWEAGRGWSPLIWERENYPHLMSSGFATGGVTLVKITGKALMALQGGLPPLDFAQERNQWAGGSKTYELSAICHGVEQRASDTRREPLSISCG